MAAITLGLAIGYARMSVGAHFLSDVLFAGFFTLLTGLVLYYAVLSIPAVENRHFLSRKNQQESQG